MATKFITVSIEIMHDTNLNQSQKFIYAEIEQLSSLAKGCIASNQHFSELIGITKENVSRNINDLQKKGYINVEIVNGTRNHTRIITITDLVSLTKVVRPPYQSSKTPLLKQQETKENKTINKTINKTLEKKQSLNSQIESKLSEATSININAFNEWLDYKKYKTIAPITKTINFLNNYDFITQQQIVDTSIMNNYKGLFEPKQKSKQQPYNAPKSQTLNTDINIWDEIEKQGNNQEFIDG